MNKTKLACLLIVGSTFGSMTMHGRHNLTKMHGAWTRHMENLWREFDTLFDQDFDVIELPVYDAKSVALPEINIKKEEDNSIVIQLKGLTAKENEIKGIYDEEEDSAQYTFPYKESTITLHIAPRGIVMKGEKKITEEKKDPKGNVIASSNYSAYNSAYERLPVRVNVSKITREYKDGTLTIKLAPRHAKRPI